MRQHRIDHKNPPITDAMTDHGIGTGIHAIVGCTVLTAYDIPDSDRAESLLLLDDGTVLVLSCDPAYDDVGVHRTPEHWECCVYDVTTTPAGREIKKLAEGHWL